MIEPTIPIGPQGKILLVETREQLENVRSSLATSESEADDGTKVAVCDEALLL